jgi:hypothetical protein
LMKRSRYFNPVVRRNIRSANPRELHREVTDRELRAWE